MKLVSASCVLKIIIAYTSLGFSGVIPSVGKPIGCITVSQMIDCYGSHFQLNENLIAFICCAMLPVFRW
jgi:hypothetical protein